MYIRHYGSDNLLPVNKNIQLFIHYFPAMAAMEADRRRPRQPAQCLTGCSGSNPDLKIV
jgi:hypothetical protein